MSEFDPFVTLKDEADAAASREEIYRRARESHERAERAKMPEWFEEIKRFEAALANMSDLADVAYYAEFLVKPRTNPALEPYIAQCRPIVRDIIRYSAIIETIKAEITIMLMDAQEQIDAERAQED